MTERSSDTSFLMLDIIENSNKNLSEQRGGDSSRKRWDTLSPVGHNDEHDTVVSVIWAACKSFRYHKITFMEDFKESNNILTEGLE